jgi:hypothetical protein
VKRAGEQTSRAARLLELVGANWTTQAIGAAVSLGLVDELARQAGATSALAQRTGCDPGSVLRLLRALAGIDIVERHPDGSWALTPMGELLQADVPGSVRDWALWCSGPQWALWGDLAVSVRTGRSARARTGMAPGYAHLEDDAAAARVFHGAMAGLSGRIGRAVADAIDWSRSARVVDIGGGYGELVAEILIAHPHLRGLIVDLPHATTHAAERLASRGLDTRCAVVAGSFFDELPPQADTYLLKSILHNWDDGDALRILQRCRGAMNPKSRLLLIERVMPEQPARQRRSRAILRSDLNMLVSLGGRERTVEEFARLANQAGLDRPRRKAAALDFSVLELRRARHND